MGQHVGDQYGRLIGTLGLAIASGQLPAGHVVTLDRLGAEHQVSRSVAREVVRVLESMGMVRTRRRVGITVGPVDQWNAFDPRIIGWRLEAADSSAALASLSELRRAVEPTAAALAARRAAPEHCRTMAVAVADMAIHARSGDVAAYLQADQLFHRTLMEASGNDMFRALTPVVAQLISTRSDLLAEQGPDPEVIALHDDVARAIRLRDESAAEQGMRAILAEASPLRPPRH